MSVKVVLYTKPGCHLCERVEDKLLEVQLDNPFELTKVDLRDDPALMSKYGLDIPVVTIDGALFSVHVLNKNLFESKIKEMNTQHANTI